MRRRVDSVATVGEFALLARLLPTLPQRGDVVVGPGDDCAVLRAGGRRWLFTVDALVEGVHFRRGWLTPAQLGRKAFAVNASDLAAMGGRPRWAVLQLGAPATLPAGDLLAIARAVARAAAAAGATLVGGNLSSARELSAVVALLGECAAPPVLRRGARPGDLLYVTGVLGDAALGRRRLARDPRARGTAVARFRDPPARLDAGAQLARAGLAVAMIDVSDGLVQDLGHLCRASGVGAVVRADRVPCSPAVRRVDRMLALTGGEDYELLCAVRPRFRRRVERLATRLDCPFTCIGECTSGRRVRVVDERGRAVRLARGGHAHFSVR